MAKGKKTGGRDFIPGVVTNPHGRPKIPADLKELKQLNQIELERVLNESLLLTPMQLKKIKDDPESTMLQLLIVSIITHGTNKGDAMRLNFLLDRLIGKVKDNVNLSGGILIDRPLRDLPSAELLKQLPEAIQLLKGGE